MAEKEPKQTTESIVELFHKVASLIPGNQKIITTTLEESVADALKKMEAHNFSQLPVTSGTAVLGLFSYRSLTRKLGEIKHSDGDFSSLKVEDYMNDKPRYVQPNDDWTTILDDLDKEDVVLVGSWDNLRGILTAMDFLHYLQDIANPFVLIAEIETSLRSLIEVCVNQEELDTCVEKSLKHIYSVEDLPIPLDSLTFNDYVQIIGHPENWTKFEAVISHKDSRKDVIAILNEVRDLRNTTFHFKRKMTETDTDMLTRHREWLQRRAKAYEGIRKKQKTNESKKKEVRKKSRLNPDTLRAAVSPLQADFLFWMHDEAVRDHFIIEWNQDSFVVRTLVNGNKVSFIFGSIWGEIRIYMHRALGLTPSQTAAWRQELNKYGVLKKNGEANLTGHIRPENQDTLREIVLYLFKQVKALTRYPLEIQAIVNDVTYDAMMLDTEGRVVFKGTEYSSVSAAGKAAVGWPSCNGWTFWHYIDDTTGERRPIDDLRK